MKDQSELERLGKTSWKAYRVFELASVNPQYNKNTNNKKHFYSTSYVPGTVTRTLHLLTHLILTKSL